MFKAQNVFKTRSEISGEIRVTQMGKERRLLVGGYVQSINSDCPGIEKRVWGRIVSLALEHCVNPKNILILGLGGGTIISLLKKYKPDAEITAIELDPAIVDIAKKCFHLSNVKGLEIVVGDALNFVTKTCGYTNSLGEFDVIIVDVYCGGEFPIKFWGDEFFISLKKLLDKGGVVIFNRIVDIKPAKIIEELQMELEKHFSKVKIERVNIVGNSGNVLMVCRK